MRLLCGLATACMLLTMSMTSNAAFITTLRNTGIDSGGAVLANGGAEINYKLVTKPAASSASLIAVTSAGGFPVPPWLGDNSTSTWIRPDNPFPGQGSFDNDPDGTYVYETKFSMSGLRASTALITGRWSTDNPGLSIKLNGVSIVPASNTYPFGFSVWTPFTISAASNLFLSGVNTLQFTVTNLVQATQNPTGLRVEMIGTADLLPQGGPTVPLPASLALLLTGFPGLGLLVSRLRKPSK